MPLTLKNFYKQWRQPWANTLLYLPLNSTDTYTDQSWNNVQTTNNWVTFWTYQWVDCWYFSSAHIQVDPFTYPSDITILCRCYCFSTDSDGKIIDARDWNSNNFITAFENSPVNVYMSTSNYIRILWDYKNRWVLCAFSSTNNSQYIRILGDNLDLNNTWTDTYSSFTPIYINIWNEWDNWASRHFYWWMSNLIVENKVWTDQEIEDYFSQTKSLYGIS